MQEQQGKPLVSVVMATYNGERFLDEQLLSIRNQTYTTLEIIVVDDASTDSTLDILRRHAAQDDRIRIHVNACNQGTAAAFEAGFLMVQGEFVAISDQDDVWLPKKIAVLLEQIKDCDAIYTDSELIDGHGQLLGTSLLQRLAVRAPVSGRDFFQLLCRNCVSGHSMLLRSRLIAIAAPLSRDAGFVYDQQLAVFAMMNAGLGFHEHSLTLHRMHDNNQVNGFMKSGAKQRENRQSRYVRLQSQLQSNIAFLRAHVDRHADWYARDAQLLQAVRYLGKIHDGIAKRTTYRFSPRLFLLFLQKRHQLFYFSRKNRILLCSRLARGKLI